MDPSIHNQKFARLFSAGGHDALDAVFKEYYRPLWNFANSLIHDRWEAEDIVVETFLKLWKLRSNFDTDQNIKAFLYITVRNACLNYLKHVDVKRHSHKELLYLNGESADEDIEDIVNCKIIESEILREIIREIKELPPKMKVIFELIFMHGLSTAEISRKLKLSDATIRGQKAKALKEIRLALAKKRLLPSFGILLLGKSIIHWFTK